MRPTKEFCELVRARVKELTGTDPGNLNIRDIFLGTDPNATDAQRIEALAQSLARMFAGDFEIIEDDEP